MRIGPSDIETRSALPEEAPQAISTVVAAFIADPFARFLWPSVHDHLHVAPSFIRAFAGEGFEHGSAYVTADLCGAALWLPPGVHPDGEAVERILRDSVKPEHLDDALLTLQQMEECRKKPHWYLPTIGVEPNARGRGLGAALMRHAVSRCDADGLAAYLESTNPRNISLYQRHGFEIVREIQVGTCPVVTPMVRSARCRVD